MKRLLFSLGCMTFCTVLVCLPAGAQNQQDCSRINNKVLRVLCEAGQATGQNQTPSTSSEDSKQLIEDATAGKIPCNDPRVLSLPTTKKVPGVKDKDANFIRCVMARLFNKNRIALPQGAGQRWFFEVIHNTEINSKAIRLNTGQLAVLAYDSMAQFVNYDPDEEAFVIGHEIGHIQDWQNCENLKARLSQEFLHTRAQLNEVQRTCEEHADYYGLQYAWGAGFNPYAAGAWMGRIEMYLPNQTRGLSSTLNNLTSDHPISSERTKKLRAEMYQLCSQSGTVCRP